MNKVHVLFFATLKEKAGLSETQLDLLDGSNVAGFKKALFTRFPDLPRMSSTLVVAVNQEFAFDTDPIPAGAEIAVFPPVSGG